MGERSGEEEGLKIRGKFPLPIGFFFLFLIIYWGFFPFLDSKINQSNGG